MDIPVTPHKSRPSLMWPATIIIACLIIGGAIFASQISKQRSIEKQEQIDRQENANTKKAEADAELTRQGQLDYCIAGADANYNLYLEKNGTLKPGTNSTWQLPTDQVAVVQKTRQDAIDNCHKLYPAK